MEKIELIPRHLIAFRVSFRRVPENQRTRVALWTGKHFSFVNDDLISARFTLSETGLFGVGKPRPKTQRTARLLRCVHDAPRSPVLSRPAFDASFADSVPTCLGRNAPNAVLCSSRLTMKGAVILRHKYFILHLNADTRRGTRNTNALGCEK